VFICLDLRRPVKNEDVEDTVDVEMDERELGRSLSFTHLFLKFLQPFGQP